MAVVAYGKAQRTDGDRPAYFMTEADFGEADKTGVPANNRGINTVDLSMAAKPAAPATATLKYCIYPNCTRKR